MQQERTAQPLRPITLASVAVEDSFWSPKRRIWQQVTLRDAFRKFEDDGAFANFDRVRDRRAGGHCGRPWYDGLVYEMICAAADFLAAEPDPALEAQLDVYIARITAAAAVDPDGYLNTYTQLEEPDHRWGLGGGYEVWQHDVYNAGALVEAGIHHYRATAKTTLLDVGLRFANHMCVTFGWPPKRNIVPSHSLPEEALVELYLLCRDDVSLKQRAAHPVRERSYLELAEFWIEARGHHSGVPDWEREGRSRAEELIRSQIYGDRRPSWGTYAQDMTPVLEQEVIEGHAVRATLLCSGLAAAARVNGRDDYHAAALRLWNNLVSRRMYITGGVGTFAEEEEFGPDYVLPNDAYLETCAAVGAAFFHRNMNLAFGQARFVDELERVLYNGALSGVSLAGGEYFYENPLEADKPRARWAWHSCPCCPPMFLKLMGALPGYIYAADAEGVYVNLFVGSRATLQLGTTRVTVRQTTQYPWHGQVTLMVEPEQPVEFDVNIRIPAWSPTATITVNGTAVRAGDPVSGYARIRRHWRRTDVVEVTIALPIERTKAHPLVQADIGRTVLTRGPLVYCLEAGDNGGRVHNLRLAEDVPLEAEFRADLLGGVMVLRGVAQAIDEAAWADRLYAPANAGARSRPVPLLLIPYYAVANRALGEMTVWIPQC